MTDRDEHAFFVLCCLYHKQKALGLLPSRRIGTCGGASPWNPSLLAIGRNDFGVDSFSVYSRIYAKAKTFIKKIGVPTADEWDALIAEASEKKAA